MGAAVDKRENIGISDRADRALSIDAGALAFAEGSDEVFDLPDKDHRSISQHASDARLRSVDNDSALSLR